MNHPPLPAVRAATAAALGLVAAGLGLLVAAWLLPVNLKSLNPVLLREAGRGTPAVAEAGLGLVEAEKPGPAGLVLAAARTVGDPGASRLATALAAFARRSPELIPWGGWDPFLDPLFNLQDKPRAAGSTPVLNFFITQKARSALRAYLANSRSQAVQAARLGAMPASSRSLSSYQNSRFSEAPWAHSRSSVWSSRSKKAGWGASKGISRATTSQQ